MTENSGTQTEVNNNNNNYDCQHQSRLYATPTRRISARRENSPSNEVSTLNVTPTRRSINTYVSSSSTTATTTTPVQRIMSNLSIHPSEVCSTTPTRRIVTYASREIISTPSTPSKAVFAIVSPPKKTPPKGNPSTPIRLFYGSSNSSSSHSSPNSEDPALESSCSSQQLKDLIGKIKLLWTVIGDNDDPLWKSINTQITIKFKELELYDRSGLDTLTPGSGLFSVLPLEIKHEIWLMLNVHDILLKVQLLNKHLKESIDPQIEQYFWRRVVQKHWNDDNKLYNNTQLYNLEFSAKAKSWYFVAGMLSTPTFTNDQEKVYCRDNWIIKKTYKTSLIQSEAQNEAANGYGQGVWENGDLYLGMWKNGHRNGIGHYTWPSGDQYHGTYNEDKREGHGTYTFHDQNVYDGQWKANNRQGLGLLTFHNGDIYFGQWELNSMEGWGRMIYHNGGIYDGEWSRGVRGGVGIMSKEKGRKYIGCWKKGVKHGVGVCMDPVSGNVKGKWHRGFLVSTETSLSEEELQSWCEGITDYLMEKRQEENET